MLSNTYSKLLFSSAVCCILEWRRTVSSDELSLSSSEVFTWTLCHVGSNFIFAEELALRCMRVHVRLNMWDATPISVIQCVLSRDIIFSPDLSLLRCAECRSFLLKAIILLIGNVNSNESWKNAFLSLAVSDDLECYESQIDSKTVVAPWAVNIFWVPIICTVGVCSLTCWIVCKDYGSGDYVLYLSLLQSLSNSASNDWSVKTILAV